MLHLTFSRHLIRECFLGPQQRSQILFFVRKSLRSESNLVRKTLHEFNRWLVPCNGHVTRGCCTLPPDVDSLRLSDTSVFALEILGPALGAVGLGSSKISAGSYFCFAILRMNFAKTLKAGYAWSWCSLYVLTYRAHFS